MALEFSELTDVKTVEGYRIALTPNNSFVVYAPDGIRGFPDLASGYRRRDASPIKFIGRLNSVPPAVEAALVELLTKLAETRRKIAREYGDEINEDERERGEEIHEVVEEDEVEEPAEEVAPPPCTELTA